MWITSHNPLAGFECERFVFQDGAFMVRQSSGQDAQQPYTLVVFYKGRVYNIPIRFISTSQQYALGREKKGEEVQWWTFHFQFDCLNVTYNLHTQIKWRTVSIVHYIVNKV